MVECCSERCLFRYLFMTILSGSPFFSFRTLILYCVVLQTRNAMSGTYSAPQRSASSAALLVGDTGITRDKAGNFVLPRADVSKLRERLRNEEQAAGLAWWPGFSALFSPFDSSTDAGYRRKLCAHARILALEEAIDTEWVYMWDKFGGYLLLVLGHATRAERVQVSFLYFQTSPALLILFF